MASSINLGLGEHPINGEPAECLASQPNDTFAPPILYTDSRGQAHREALGCFNLWPRF